MPTSVRVIDEQTTLTMAETLDLQRDLGINLAGAALALDLLERIEVLDAQLRAMRGGRERLG